MIKKPILAILLLAIFTCVVVIVVVLRPGTSERGSREQKSVADPAPQPREVVLLTYGNYVAPGVLARWESDMGIRVVTRTYSDQTSLNDALADVRQHIDVVIMNGEWVPGMKVGGVLAMFGAVEGETTWQKSFVAGVTARSDDPEDRYTRPYFAYRLGLLMRQGQEMRRITTMEEMLGHTPLAVGTDPMLTMAGIRALGGVDQQAVGGRWTAEQTRVLRTLLHGAGGPGALPGHEAAALVVKGHVRAALLGGGDAARAMRDQPGLRFVPIGAADVVRVDVLAVPARSTRKAAAERLVMWLCSAAAGTENAQYAGYPSPLVHPDCVAAVDPSISAMVAWQRSVGSTFIQDYVTPEPSLLQMWADLRE